MTSNHKSEDYKLSAVEYYLVGDKSQVEVCEIFKCSPRSLMRWFEKYETDDEIKRENRKPVAYKVHKEHVKFLLDEIKATYTGSNLTKANFVELPHGYDEDDFLSSDILKNDTSHTLKIVYAGSVYLGAKSYFEEFINQINKYNCKNEHLVELEIYMDDYKSLHQFQNAAVSIKPSVGKDIFKVISEADYVLILLAEHNKDFKTTKFYEFLPFQKPYLYIGSLGEVAKNISEDEMGFVIKDVKNETVSFIESHFSSNLVFKGLSKFKNHTFQKRVELINNLIEKIDA